MAKEIQYFALVSRFGPAFMRVVGVTSEKGGQWYGRDHQDQATHGSLDDIIYRFPEGTEWEFAHAATVRAREEHERHDPAVKAAKRQWLNLEDARSEAMIVAAKGLMV